MTFLRHVLLTASLLAVSACGSAGGSEDSVSVTSESTSAVEEVPEPDAEFTVEDPADSLPPTTEHSPTGDGDLPFGLRRCGVDFSVISADQSFYRDEPVYVGNEQPADEVRAWAQQQPGFEELWIDRDNNGWIVVGFTSDATQRQAELESEFPGVGVAAAELEFGRAELDLVRDEVFATMTANGIPVQGGASVPSGEVSVFVGVLDEATLEPFVEFADDPVCFEGVEPEDAVIDGPQPSDGEGWRLLAVERTGDSFRTGVATDREQYAALWDLSGVTTEQPMVDFNNEIVIWFGAVYGSGCEIRMDDVVFDLERSIVHGEFVIPGNPGACNGDANPEAYVVAVERASLPVGGFSVQLSASGPPRGAPEERTVVDVDLSEPGSIATDESLGGDASLVQQYEQGYVIGPGGIVEPGFSAAFEFDLTCPVDVVGPINGVVWQHIDQDRGPIVDPAWADLSEVSDVVFVEVLVETDPARMSLNANGVTESYLPAGSQIESGCES